MSPRIVTVFGATGSQGSSVVRALLADGTFSVRAVTRNTGSASALALKSQGVEVVEANLLNKDSVEKAIAGSEAVFGVTNFWDSDNFDKEKVKKLSADSDQSSIEDEPEAIQGRNLVEALKKAGVQFFVWSSLPSTSEISKAAHEANPKIKHFTTIKHYDSKAVTDKLLETSGLKYAILHTGWFLENVKSPFAVVKNGDGSYTISAPNFKADVPHPDQAFSWISRDMGPSVLALLKHYRSHASQILGKTFFMVNERTSFQRLAKALTESTGTQVTFSADAKSISEIEDTYEYQAVVGTYRDVEIPDPRLVALGVKFGTIEEFVAEPDVKKAFA